MTFFSLNKLNSESRVYSKGSTPLLCYKGSCDISLEFFRFPLALYENYAGRRVNVEALNFVSTSGSKY